jgi:hypothetical protein
LLRFFPFNLFPAPTIEGNETMSAEEFTRRWEAGDEDFLLTAYFQTDVHDLSQALSEWCRSPSERARQRAVLEHPQAGHEGRLAGGLATVTPGRTLIQPAQKEST